MDGFYRVWMREGFSQFKGLMGREGMRLQRDQAFPVGTFFELMSV